MISFVFYFHSARYHNLAQTLRFLENREILDREVILVCNDSMEVRPRGCRLINMGLAEYRKPLMCNTGVNEAKGDMVALMDADRIMPAGYFSRAANEVKRGQFMSCRRILNLSRPHSDEEIERGDLQVAEEWRAEGCELWRRNLFSGNTVFHREDYLKSGGMDESFVGYGFADTDMTMNVISKGFLPVWSDETEIHLHHEKDVSWNGSMHGKETRKKMAESNLCRFLKKWRMKEYLRRCGRIL
jgi:hypothetical protein